MARRFRKSDVQFHADGPCRAARPAINVKVRGLQCTTDGVMRKFGCTEEQAEKALELAWDSECEQFWGYWQDTTGDLENGICGSPEYAYFPGHDVKVWSEGRSGGWLVVEGLPYVRDWDAVLVSRWAKFCKDVLADIAYRISKECLLDAIEANEWWKEYSEQYNFYHDRDRTICVADAKADVIAYAKEKHGFVPSLP